MNIETCNQHGIPKTHICLHKDCQKSYRLLCEKCCFHAQHKNRTFLFADLKQKLIKSRPNSLGFGLQLRLYDFRNKIKHFGNFRHFILQKEKVLFQKQKQLRKYLIQLQMEENNINSFINQIQESTNEQQINKLFNDIQPFINFHTINSKLILGSKDFRNNQQRLHRTIQVGLEYVSSIREYVLKIIQVLMYKTQNNDLQQQKIANEKYNIMSEIQKMLIEETQMLQQQVKSKKESLQIIKANSQSQQSILQQEKNDLFKIINQKNMEISSLKQIIQKKNQQLKGLQTIYLQQIKQVKYEIKDIRRGVESIKQQIEQTIHDQIQSLDHQANSQVQQLCKVYKCSAKQLFTTILQHNQNLNKKISSIAAQKQLSIIQVNEKAKGITNLSQIIKNLQIQLNQDHNRKKIQKQEQYLDFEVLRRNHLKPKVEKDFKMTTTKMNYSMVSSRKKQNSLFKSANIGQQKQQQLNFSQRNSESELQNIIYNYRQESQQKVHLLKDALNQKQKIINDINKQLDMLYKQKQKNYKNYVISESKRLKEKKIVGECEMKNQQLKQQNNQLLTLINRFKIEIQRNELILRSNQVQIGELEMLILKLQIQVKKKDQTVILCRKQLNILRNQAQRDLISLQSSKKKKPQFIRKMYCDTIKKQTFKQNSQKNILSQESIPIQIKEKVKSHQLILQNTTSKQENLHSTCQSLNSLRKQSQIQQHLKAKKLFQVMNKDVIALENNFSQTNAIESIYERQLDKKRNQNKQLKRQLAEIKKNQLIIQANRIIKQKNKRVMTTSFIQ